MDTLSWKTGPRRLRIAETEGLSETTLDSVPFVLADITKNRVAGSYSYGENAWSISARLDRLKQEEMLAALIDYMQLVTIASIKGKSVTNFIAICKIKRNNSWR